MRGSSWGKGEEAERGVGETRLAEAARTPG